MSQTQGSDGETDGQGGNQCEMCPRTDRVKAVRDPENNLLDMCAECRAQWPVTEVEA